MCVIHSFREQYWRESTFNGLKLVRSALDEAFGAGKVSLISAAFRWLNHHSQMKPEYNGEWESGSLGPASQLLGKLDIFCHVCDVKCCCKACNYRAVWNIMRALSKQCWQSNIELVILQAAKFLYLQNTDMHVAS